MTEWHAFARDPLDHASLAEELTQWTVKQPVNLRLFREGATICDLSWASAELVVAEQLERLWHIRLFCRRFELSARRRGCDSGSDWQLRIVGPAEELPDGQPLTPLGRTSAVMLLGERSDGGEFIDTPNRYRRARLAYPVDPQERNGQLIVQQFRFASGVEPDGEENVEESSGLLTCWVDIVTTSD